MIKVYVAQQTWDAQMVCALLEQQDVPAFVQPEYAPHEVWIYNDEDRARALEVVGSFTVEASKHKSPDGIVWTWRCRACREDVEPQFQACWNCGALRAP